MANNLSKIGSRGQDIFKIKLENIVEGENLREDFDEQELENLSISLFMVGQESPVRAYYREDGKAVLTDGARRFRAANLANEKFGKNIEYLLAIPSKKLSSAELALNQITSNNLGSPLKPIEVANGYKKMIDDGWDIDKISKSVNRTKSHISSYLKMLEAPEQVLKAVESKKISATAATIVARSTDDGKKEIGEKIDKGEKVLVKDAQKASYGRASQISSTHIEFVMKKCISMVKGVSENIDALKWDFGYQICQVILGKMSIEELE